ncbi:MAG: ABC transporter permease, partial [Chloroflexota bacterium]
MLNRVISPRWRKVQRDLWSNRARTLLVVASIAVGIFAVGVVQHIRTVVLDEMQAVYDQSNAAHATIYAGGVDDEMLEVIRRVPGVSEAEGRSLVSVNVNVATPGEPELWESISLTAVDDFTEARVNLLVPQLDDNRAFNAESSSSFLRWPEKDELVIERSAFQSAGALPEGLAVGDTLQVETSEGKARTLTLTGSVHDANMMPASFSGSASGYIDMETAERLGGSRDYSIVYVRVEGDRTQIMDEGYVEGIADDVADKIEKGGLAVQRVQVFSPGELPLQSLFDSITLVLTPLGI